MGVGGRMPMLIRQTGRLVEMLTRSLAFQQNPQSASRELIAFIQALMAGGGGEEGQ